MKKLLTLFLSAALLSGCSSWPYHIEIQQGNVVTPAMLAQLKPGMTPNQVRFVLGTPLIVDPFHTDRWDYPYMLEKGGKVVAKRHVTIWFKNGLYDHTTGDIKPEAAQPGPVAATGQEAQPAEKAETAKPAAAKPAPRFPNPYTNIQP